MASDKDNIVFEKTSFLQGGNSSFIQDLYLKYLKILFKAETLFIFHEESEKSTFSLFHFFTLFTFFTFSLFSDSVSYITLPICHMCTAVP